MMIDPALSRVVRSTWHSKVILRARANVVQWEGSPESCGHVCACALVGIVPVASRTRKEQRRQNFLAGRARSAHRLPQFLQAPNSRGSTASSSTPCKRGCPQVLSGLKPAFDAAGLHPAKTRAKRLASYPIPKKQKVAHRNIRGKIIIDKQKFNVSVPCTESLQ